MLIGGLVLGGVVVAAVPIRATVSVDVSNTQNANSKTDIRVETNGEVKEFHTQGDEDVNYQSDDGSVKVKVNNDSASSTTATTKTVTKNEVKVAVEEEGEAFDEVEDATNSSDMNEKAGVENASIDQEDLSLIENFLNKWEEWSEAIKDRLGKLFG